VYTMDKQSEFDLISGIEERLINGASTEEEVIMMQLISIIKRQNSEIKDYKTQLKEAHELLVEAKDASLRDGMTGLYGKKAIIEYFRQQMSNNVNKERMNSCFVVEIDMDNFKSINDEYGHTVGDDAIKIVASSLMAKFKSKDLVVRAGGDEFLVFVKNLDEPTLSHKLEEVRAEITESLHGLLDARGAELGIERDKTYGLSLGYTQMNLGSLSQEMLRDEGAFTADWLNPHLVEADDILYQDKKLREKAGLRAGR